MKREDRASMAGGSAAGAEDMESGASVTEIVRAVSGGGLYSPDPDPDPERPLQWLPYELHCHTFHSDGKQSLAELASAAKALGLSGAALTDHNTMTGLAGRETVSGETGVHIIPGLEWTTFFGHMLTLGLREYVDWRGLSPFHIHRGIDGVHQQGGVVGVAHPFRVGSPMCTGCFWEFEVTDWSQVDYIEVWSGLFPSIRRNNGRAFAWWTELLNRGYRIAATSGRDWHESAEPLTEPVAATFLGMDGDATDGKVIEAIQRGTIAVSMGPRPDLFVHDPANGSLWGIGDTAVLSRGSQGNVQVIVGTDFKAREGHWELAGSTLKLRLVSNKGELAELQVTKEQPQASVTLSLAGVIWLRAELIGYFAERIR